MIYILIGLHAIFGEVGALTFLWCLVETMEPTPLRLRRARRAALIGVVLLALSWFVGGYYYLMHYGPNVKPAIQAGSLRWAHGIAMELKEHVFLFLPFLGMSVYGRLRGSGDDPERLNRTAVILESFLIVLIAFAIAGLGYLVMLGAHIHGG
ncbi:MAG: hypothetical protein M5U26_12965 [Planctomycetota bacterium]|nr:hypothetical protein [Planctomycetota bacterium]